MTSKSQIQSYLKQNKVSELFEDMMGKLIHDLPSNPVSYLIGFLQKKDQKKKLSTSQKFDSKATPSTKRLSSSHNANMWSGSPTRAQSPPIPKTEKSENKNETNRQYSKPWQSHSKKSPLKESKSVLSSQTLPASFDKFSKTKQTKSSYDFDSNKTNDQDADLRLLYGKPKVFGKVSNEQYSDNLDSEMKCQSTDEVELKTTKNVSKDPRKEKLLRRKNLNETVKKMNREKENVNVGSHSDEGSEDDDAIEICEDYSLLQEEGIKHPPKTGVHPILNTNRRKEEIELVLNMSKFFDSLGGSMNAGDEVNSTISTAHPDNDEDFESASQVTGPRKPVWGRPTSEVDSYVSKSNSKVARRRGLAATFDLPGSTVGKKK